MNSCVRHNVGNVTEEIFTSYPDGCGTRMYITTVYSYTNKDVLNWFWTIYACRLYVH